MHLPAVPHTESQLLYFHHANEDPKGYEWPVPSSVKVGLDEARKEVAPTD